MKSKIKAGSNNKAKGTTMFSRSIMIKIAIGVCLILVAMYTRAAASSDVGLKGFGPRIGYVDPEGTFDGSVELGMVFDFGEFAKQLRWDGSISYWSTGQDYKYHNGNRYDTYSWKLSDLALRSGLNYHFTQGDWVPYLGGGLGMHFYTWDYNEAPFYSNSSDSKFGIYLDGGIEHKLSANWTGQMQVQLDFADPDQTALLFNFIYRLH
ncbi:MAG: hypothetical protein OEM52_04005 [bacterium]|nr:hypothetical protein [bacterium]